MTLILGIDPGITGAIAWLRDGTLDRVEDMPVAEIKVGKGFRKRLVPALLATMLDLPNISHVFLEEVASRPGEGAVGAFSFGCGFGMIQGVLATLCLPYTLVRPQAWKTAMRVPADKGSAIARACREFPAMASKFARVKDDGRAEASLIALYGFSHAK